MADFKIKTLSWLAPLALVGTVGLAACGDDDASESTRTVSPAAVANGSDRHLVNLAADAEVRAAVAGSDVHLANQAAESARLTAEAEAYESTGAIAAAAGSDVHLANQAAEAAEQPEPSSDEFVPGTRRMPAR